MGGLLCADVARHNPGRGMGRRNKVLHLWWTEEIRIRGVIFVIEATCEACFGKESTVFSR